LCRLVWLLGWLLLGYLMLAASYSVEGQASG
jgi:hypothetical protein